MLFNSFHFIIFFPIVVIIYFLIPRKIRYIWLLLCSYFIYSFNNYNHTIILILSTILTYFTGIILEKILNKKYIREKYKKILLFLSIILNLLLLIVFKYLPFITDNINNIFKLDLNISKFNIFLPIGISFYTFQTLSYIIDIYNGKTKAEKNFLKYALFVSFFPQLVAGPIERSSDLFKQFNKKHKFDFKNIKNGILLILWGFFLKLVIADRTALFVNQVYNNIDLYDGLYLVIATILFSFQIYTDFNGYTSIARGSAKLMGFNLSENFNAPYLSKNVTEFWKKWHITLSNWFRDYIYIPLGGNKKGKISKYFNIFIVFIISGLWHGANWNFIVWGILNGLYIIIEQITIPIKEYIIKYFNINTKSFSHKLLLRIKTFCFITFSWIFFRASSLKTAFKIIKKIFKYNPIILYDNSIYKLGIYQMEFRFLNYMLIILLFVDILKYKKVDILKKISEQGIWLRFFIYLFLLWIILMFGIYGVEYDENSFVYFQF